MGFNLLHGHGRFFSMSTNLLVHLFVCSPYSINTVLYCLYDHISNSIIQKEKIDKTNENFILEDDLNIDVLKLENPTKNLCSFQIHTSLESFLLFSRIASN